MDAYAPPRHLAAKLERRLTQWTPARPAKLSFDEPMLSVCFDDFPASAASAGARVLESHGARGTFYAAAGLAGRDGPCGRNFSAGDLQRLEAAGHEIGCHTYDHADCAKRGVLDTLHDLARNRDVLAAMGLTQPLKTLAYPYGETSRALKQVLPPRFACARGVLPGLNVGKRDLAQLRAYPLFGDMKRAHRALKAAARQKAWLIVFTHDVGDAPSPFGTSTRDLDAFLQGARELGVTAAPVSTALATGLA
ncbi:polysaccharide deacetylase family protein [Terricaulis sp.]|uniref:polysaccharide deacetylase family protein n=1 Tax=Terricaulis sp. TaxID=2768686 RepID=UPI0037831D99